MPTSAPVPTSSPVAPSASPVPPLASAAPAPTAASTGRPFRSRLRLALDPADSPKGHDCLASLVLDRPGTDPLTIRARDEHSAFPDSAALGGAALQNRMARTPGFQNRGGAPADVLGTGQGLERRFAMESGGAVVEMFELYLVLDGRCYVVAGPMAARDLGSGLRLRAKASSAVPIFESRFDVVLPSGWVAHEQVSLRRSGTAHALTADRWVPRSPADPGQWSSQQVGALVRGNATLANQTAGNVLGLPGVVSTIQWTSQGVPMLTKLGTAADADEGVSMVLSLPHAEQAVFPSLARHAQGLAGR